MLRKIFLTTMAAITILSSLVLFAAPATAAEPVEVEAAVDSGIQWLVNQQNPDGSWGTTYELPWGTFQFKPILKAGLSVTVLAEYASDPTYGGGLQNPLDPTFVYHENLILGLYYILYNAQVQEICPQPAGDPDANGNGIGIYFTSSFIGFPIYETSAALMALCSTKSPDAIIELPGSPLNGLSYGEVAQDIVDWLAWAQTDGDYLYERGRGGWTYTAMDNGFGRSDQSNTGYATLALAFAESKAFGFESTIPEFVKSELDIWVDYIQNDPGPDDDSWCVDPDGGSGFSAPGPFPGGGSDDYWVTIQQTGNLLQQMALLGDPADALRVEYAVDYIYRHWYDPDSTVGWQDPNMGVASYQASYCIMKGLESLGVNEISGIYWYDEISSTLVAQQNSDGSWPMCIWDDGERLMATQWALLTLLKATPPYISEVTATVRIEPEALNLNSKGVFTVFICLPEGLNVADIDIASLTCEGASAVDATVSDKSLVVKFNRGDLTNVSSGDEVALYVKGALVGGSTFEGSDVIKVISK